jgi:L-cysteine S-thiosulfotransferase
VSYKNLNKQYQSMTCFKALLCIFLAVQASAVSVVLAQDKRTSGQVYLSKQMQDLQADAARNPISLWQERGQALWQGQCKSCHGEMVTLKASAPSFPRLSTDGKSLINLEDQIARCQQRQSGAAVANASNTSLSIDSDEVLSLSVALHQVAVSEPIKVAAPIGNAGAEVQWQARLSSGEKLYQTRIGRMNLACMHCHDQKVGTQMRADTISQGHPTGFPIYRMSWQTVGTIDRRLRACYSGVQATVPPSGSPELRDLELFLKVRANGMPLDGPSIRR